MITEVTLSTTHPWKKEESEPKYAIYIGLEKDVPKRLDY